MFETILITVITIFKDIEPVMNNHLLFETPMQLVFQYQKIF